MPAFPAAQASAASMFGRLRHEIDQLFEDFTMPDQMRRMLPFADGMDFSPLAELKDKADHYEFTIELPGLEDKDINIDLADGVLKISGEKRQESDEKSADWLISERSYGKFQRRLSLPGDADPDKIEAKFRHGVLKVTIGKDTNSARNARKIPVS
ncbi:MAG: Hsp20/alpha crystallin family protein [Porphyrobacter sp.]|nr:Hsp20/alpha crystallin family protein [Porphyrobacter sp.]